MSAPEGQIDYAELLLSLSDDEFDELIVAESKGEQTWVTEVVTSDLECCERWVERLKAKSQASMQGISHLRVAEDEALADALSGAERQEIKATYRQRRQNVNFFRTKIDERLREAKACQSELRRTVFQGRKDDKHRGWYGILAKLAENFGAQEKLGLSDDERDILDRIAAGD